MQGLVVLGGCIAYLWALDRDLHHWLPLTGPVVAVLSMVTLFVLFSLLWIGIGMILTSLVKLAWQAIWH